MVFLGVSLFKWLCIKSEISINIHGEIHWCVLPFTAKMCKVLGEKKMYGVYFTLWRGKWWKNAWYAFVFSDHNPPGQTAVLSHSCYSPASPGAVCSLGREELQEDLTEEGVLGSGEGLCAESFQSSPKPLLTSTIWWALTAYLACA